MWDDCGEAGNYSKRFACDSNSGATFDLVLSVWPPPGIQDFTGVAAIIDFDHRTNVVSPWWDYAGCRAGNDISVTQALASTSCPDISEASFSFIADYEFTNGYPYRSRYRIFGGLRPEDAHPLPSEEMLAVCRISITRRRTIGPDACSGCEIPICISLRSVLLEAVDPRNSMLVTSGSNQFVTWQQFQYSCPFVASPATPSTWGAIKSLYR